MGQFNTIPKQFLTFISSFSVNIYYYFCQFHIISVTIVGFLSWTKRLLFDSDFDAHMMKQDLYVILGWNNFSIPFVYQIKKNQI